MKVKLVLGDRRETLEVDGSLSVSDFSAICGATLELIEDSYSLSLNGRDAVRCDGNMSLAECGIVNGDTLHIISHLPQPPRVRPVEAMELSSNELPKSWMDLCNELGVANESQAVAALVHYLMLMRGFVKCHPTTDEWLDRIVDLSRVHYSHPSSNLSCQAQIQTLGDGTVDATVAVTVFVHATVRGFKRYDIMIRLHEWCESNDNFSQTFKNWNEAVEFVSEELINRAVVACLGEQTPFLRALCIDDIRDVVFGRLTVQDICKFGSLSRTCYGLIQGQALWKMLLKRDFGASAVREADRQNISYHQAYFDKYVARHKKRQAYPTLAPTYWHNFRLPQRGPPGPGPSVPMYPPSRPLPSPDPDIPAPPGGVPDPLDPFGPRPDNPLFVRPRHPFEPPGMLGGRHDLDPFGRGPPGQGPIDPFPNLQPGPPRGRRGPRHDWTPQQGPGRRPPPRGGGGGFRG